MKYQKLGKTDLNASVVAFGGWGIGGGTVWPDMALGVKDVEDLLDAATDLGINYIDTAPVYGTGVSEELLGKALKNKDNQAVLDEIAAEVKQIATSHPMFSSEWVSPSIRKDFEDMYYNVEY